MPMMVVRTLLVHFLALTVIATSSASNTMSSAASFTVESREDVKRSTTVTFQDWLALHKKSYVSSEELELRQAIFQKNEIVVRRHNEAFDKGWTSYAMTLASPFADLTAEEFASSFLMEGQNCSATHSSSGPLRKDFDIQDLPHFVDWRTKGVITPVKNQKHCGSCWTFSTTGTLEAHTCIHGAQPEGVDCTRWTGLAEQQLLDCSSAYDNHGCNGGLPSHAYEYIKDAGGLDLEEVYHYRADSDGPCAVNENGIGAQVAEVFNITSFDEDDLVTAIAQVGPVSIAYQVSPDFRFYSHGVYDSFNATTNQTMCQSGPMDVNHAVVAVGYGETEATDKFDSIPFYIVRNSWSTSFGMEGYFWMERGKNLCGVSDCASFPIVPSSKNARLSTDKEAPGMLRASQAL